MWNPEVIGAALLLDLVLGDPRWLPHPVVLMGRFIRRAEHLIRDRLKSEMTGGILLLCSTAGTAALITAMMLQLSASAGRFAHFALSVALCWTCLALRSLHSESVIVADALNSGNIESARQFLSRIVGRDTGDLGEQEIWRALVETVAENTSDGIIAPLFWIALGGPVAGMAYKAVSTLDSMVGYRNERYDIFGRASARMDDVLNFVPARITALLLVLSATAAGLSGRGAVRILARDRKKHPSPNSGHPEAAAAGALGVRLGGPCTYGGIAGFKEYIGDPCRTFDAGVYRGMIRLMYISSFLMAALCMALIHLAGG